MSEAIKKFLALESKKEEYKKYFEELRLATEAVVKEIGLNSYFQDNADGTVFKVVAPEGKFVTFEKYGYVRTRRSHEKRGDLSIKEAKEAGFEVPGKE